MTMPVNLTLVRHGESEGNVATGRSKRGDHSDYEGEFVRRHNSKWRLTDKGIGQAEIAGEWIRENSGSTFGRYYTSEFLRAMETAYHLQLPDAHWFRDFNLRERDWGKFDLMSREEREARFTEELRNREIDGFYWRPPDGESMTELCDRVKTQVLGTLHRECSDIDVVVVCHGEVMWAFRILLERLSQRQFSVLDASKHPHDRIHNCQVVQYTRKDPQTGEIGPYLGWVRSICPSDLTLSSNDWREIERTRYSNEDLLAEVELTPRIIAE